MATTTSSLSSQTTPHAAHDQEKGPAAAAPAPKRTCGMKRVFFWLLVAAVVLACVIIAAVVGGVVGSRNAHRNKHKLATPLSAKLRAIAASSTAGESSANATMQVFYQDLDTTDILYRLVWEDDAKSEKTASLSIEPQEGTSLAVVAANSSSGGVDLSLFYLALNSSAVNATSICQAILHCDEGASSCSTTYNAMISNTTAIITPREDSGLAAVQLEGDGEYRVFYHSTENQPTLLSGSDPLVNGWSSYHAGGANTVLNSSFSANVAAESDVIDIFFVPGKGNTPREEQYRDSLGIQGAKTNRTTINDTDSSGFEPTSKFTTVYSTGLETYYFHFVQSSGAIGAWIRNSATNDTWVQHTESDWGTCDGDLASVAWGDKVRLVYMSNGELAISTNSNNVWGSVQSL